LLRSFSQSLRLLCVALALSAAACATAPPRSAAERAADAVIAGHVKDALRRAPYLYDRHIDVEVMRGVVHLDGLIWSVTEINDARLIAKQIPGVVGVVNDLDLVRSGRK